MTYRKGMQQVAVIALGGGLSRWWIEDEKRRGRIVRLTDGYALIYRRADPRTGG